MPPPLRWKKTTLTSGDAAGKTCEPYLRPVPTIEKAAVTSGEEAVACAVACSVMTAFPVIRVIAAACCTGPSARRPGQRLRGEGSDENDHDRRNHPYVAGRFRNDPVRFRVIPVEAKVNKDNRVC